MTRLLFLMAAFLLFTGCATKMSLPEDGFFVSTGNYAEEKLGKNLFRITFRGNTALSDAAASDLNLLRSAEASLYYGYHYFVIMLPDPRAKNRPGDSGNYVFASAPTVTHGSGKHGSFPIAIAMIQGFKDKLTTPFGRVYEAEPLIQTLREKYGVKRIADGQCNK